MNARATIAVIAVGLTGLGVAILRYRRRAVTGSTHNKFIRRVATGAAYASLVLAMGLVAFILCRPPHDSSRKVAGTQETPSGLHDEPPKTNDLHNPDELLRQQIVGVWTDHYQGKRTMTLRGDGTGTIDVELLGAMAVLFSERLHFDLNWNIENGRLIKECIGGQPPEKVRLILKTMGSRTEETVLELAKDRLRTSDPDNSTIYDWERIR